MRIGTLELVIIAVIAAVVLLLLMRSRHQRPANVELAELFREPITAYPGPKALAWAYGVLHEAGVEPDGDPLYAVKTLRDAEPRLSSAAARALIARMNAF